MSKYGLLMKQVGSGCDYTIECGTAFHTLKATTLEEARAEAKLVVQGEPNPGEYGGFEDTGYLLGDRFRDRPPELKLESARLVTVEETLPFKAWYDEVIENEHIKKQTNKDAQDRAEFERLKQKFGDR